ncbi:MAG: DUF3467 domain-containing protein [Planctomycetota bacterium]|nr:DUF3467 domain-containing protein [Planctomycetota bacterium]
METSNSRNPTPATPSGAGQPQAAPASQEVVLRVDERNLRSSYANAFRTNATAEEVMLDFGLNLLTPPPRQGAQPEIMFQIGERIVMNYFQAKRLALTLGQIIRRHEEQFGEIELDVNKRRKTGG